LTFGVNRKLIGADAVVKALESGEDPRSIEQRIEELSGIS
jgi:hypothetical protein